MQILTIHNNEPDNQNKLICQQVVPYIYFEVEYIYSSNEINNYKNNCNLKSINILNGLDMNQRNIFFCIDRHKVFSWCKILFE